MNAQSTRWRVVLDTQWAWTRGVLLLGSIVAFALPLVALDMAVGAKSEVAFIGTMQAWSIGYALTAGGMGLLIAIATWSYDHRLRHVYALTLPIARWRYVLQRYTAGLALLALPTIALLAGAEIASHSSAVPTTLHAYPVALTLRFAFATLVAYSIFFGISSATARTAGYVLGAIALVIVAQTVLSAAGSSVSVIGRVSDIVFATPGVLAVFSGRWTLIDV
ncbi:MAG TPA: hypothetical protein VHB25_12970 [Gemmatimonadaceae bacterium]|nr:hypothetical protein [Gemmatimonadaceae bacterium]